MAQKRKSVLILSALLFALSCSSPRPALIILCAGDSLTDSEYPRDLHRLFIQDGRRVRVRNYGRKGNTSGEYLRFLRQQKAALAEEHPDFVLVQLGTNAVRVDGDSTPAEAFNRNLKEIIAIFRGFTNRRGERAQILVATIPPLPEVFAAPFGPQSRVRVVEEINPLVRRIAAEENLVLVDNHSLFLRSPDLLPDVHPTSEGYKLLAQNWYVHLKPLINNRDPGDLSPREKY
jgi:lysophospholipase L1-like esterase